MKSNKLNLQALGIIGMIILSAFTIPNESIKMETTEVTLKAKVNYTIHGNGEKKVIVLHSWMDDYESWKPMLPYLNLDAHTYAFMDLRGYGKSKDVKGKCNSDEIANDIFDIADDLKWDEFYLVGHSMSGMAVQKAALLDSKKRIQKIVAVTPVSSAGFPVDDQTLQFFQSIPQNEEMTKTAFGAFTSNRLSDNWYEIRTKRNIEAIDKDAQLAYIEMWTKENFQEEMKSVETPFLVLTGKHDHLGFVLAEQEKAFQDFQNVDFLEIESSGHFPMFETPALLAAAIEKYLEK